jgi:hypothetical protein
MINNEYMGNIALVSPAAEYVSSFLIKTGKNTDEIQLHDILTQHLPMIRQFLVSVIETNRHWFRNVRLVHENEMSQPSMLRNTNFKIDRDIACKRAHLNKGLFALLGSLRGIHNNMASNYICLESNDTVRFCQSKYIPDEIVAHMARIWIFVKTTQSHQDLLLDHTTHSTVTSTDNFCDFLLHAIELSKGKSIANAPLTFSREDVDQFLQASMDLLYALHPQFAKSQSTKSNDSCGYHEGIYLKYDNDDAKGSIADSLFHVMRFFMLSFYDARKDTHLSFLLTLPIAEDILKTIPKWRIFRKADNITFKQGVVASVPRPVSFMIEYLQHVMLEPTPYNLARVSGRVNTENDRSIDAYAVLSMIQISLDGFLAYYLNTTVEGLLNVQEDLVMYICHKYCSVLEKLTNNNGNVFYVANISIMLSVITLLARAALMNEYMQEEKFETAYKKLKDVAETFSKSTTTENKDNWILHRFTSVSVISLIAECTPAFLYKKVQNIFTAKKRYVFDAYNSNNFQSRYQRKQIVQHCNTMHTSTTGSISCVSVYGQYSEKLHYD